MAIVAGVRFREAGKVYYFAPGELKLKRSDKVIVETARGLEFGEVVMPPIETPAKKIVQPLKEIIRLATDEDKEREAANKAREKEAFGICREKIRKHGLEMKLIDCEYTFDNSKMLFYFTADGRIDFRELVKDLAGVFHTRIELRQVGVRDETKILGGIGSCGRALCCHTYLSDFVPVSIKMAKEQNLSLNTAKISGVCGRLLCCLKNEAEVYEELNKTMPSAGDFVTTADGEKGTVQSVNILKQMVKVVVDLPNDEKEVREYPASELEFKSRRKEKKGDAKARNEDRGKDRERDKDKPKDKDKDKDGRDDNRDKGRERSKDKKDKKDRHGRRGRAEDNGNATGDKYNDSVTGGKDNGDVTGGRDDGE